MRVLNEDEAKPKDEFSTPTFFLERKRALLGTARLQGIHNVVSSHKTYNSRNVVRSHSQSRKGHNIVRSHSQSRKGHYMVSSHSQSGKGHYIVSSHYKRRRKRGMKITVLGARGSFPVAGAEYAKYGGQTSCYLVQTGENRIFLDAGSGISGGMYEVGTVTSVFLSHLHLDHIIGLPFCPGLSSKAGKIHIYGSSDGYKGYKSMQEAVNSAFHDPFWPLTIDQYPAKVDWHEVKTYESVILGDAIVDNIKSNHAGDAMIYRIRAEGKVIVYATDFEHGTDAEDELISFAKDCDLLIYDGQYTPAEYENCRGYGHSTKEKGLEIMEKSGAKQIMFTHFSPDHDDEFLEAEEARLRELNANISFARVGRELVL